MKTTNLEKLLVTGASENFYSRPSLDEPNFKTLTKGGEFFILQIEKYNEENWIKVQVDASFEGYVKQGKEVAIILPVKLNQKEVIIYSEPSIKSKEINRLNKHANFDLIHKTVGVDNPNIIWDKIRFNNGEFGFILSDTKVLVINKAYNKRMRICRNITLILTILFVYSIIVGKTIQYFDIAVLIGNLIGFIFVIIFFYIVTVLISLLFKSKMEREYYPNLINFYNNQIF